jgi:integral membrane protein (TIGR01906 family)
LQGIIKNEGGVKMRWVLSYTAALCVLVLVVSQSIIIPTFFMPFFSWHYNRAETAAEIGVTQEDLMYVTTELLAYMRGRRDFLEGITVQVDGQTRRGSRIYGQNFFTPVEIRHMVDVRVLYEHLFMVRNVAFFLLIALVLGLLYEKQKPLYLISRSVREILAGFLALISLLVVAIAIDFGRAWNIFHYIFFRGDAANYWRLTPFVDLMINMFPLDFFMHISIFAALLVLVFSAVIILAASLYLRYARRLPGFKTP